MRSYLPYVIGAAIAAYYWQGSVSFAIMVGCITMSLAQE